MRESLYDDCAARGDDTLLRQWDSGRNAPLTPASVSRGSSRRVWWRCDAGHSWCAGVKSRAAGSGCPYCAGRRLLPGENDLASARPDLAAEWDDAGNGALSPRDVLAGSHRKVWWRCARGHRWQAMISARARGAGCPVCAGRRVQPGENDLASRFPALAAEWDRARNGDLAPEGVSAFSNRRVWWRCGLGHSYQAAVAARTKGGSGCPYCAGRRVLPGFNDLATLAPLVAAQWHPTRNGALTPSDVTAGSGQRAWWQCEAGHAWRAVVYSRTGPKRCGCPICAGTGRPAREFRQIAAERRI